MIRHIFAYCWWLVLFLAIIASCALTPVKPEPLRVRLATWPGYAPLYAVARHDLAAPTMLEVSTSELAQDNYRAFAEGRVDVLATTLYSAIQYYDQGTPTVIFLVTDYSNGADGIIARAGINSVADLRGQRVGVESGSISHFVLLRALAQAGLQPDDVEMTHVGVSEAIDALDRGTVDAAVVWEPVLSKYTQTHNHPPLFTSADIPNEIIDVLVTHPETVEQRTDDLVNLARGWDRAVQGWRTGAPEISGTMATVMDVEVPDLHRQFTMIELTDLEQNRRLLDLDNPTSIRPAFENLVNFLQANGQLQASPPTPTDLINAQIVTAALGAAPD